LAVTLDRRAVGRGASGYLAIAAPCGLLIALLHGSDTSGHESTLWIVAALLVIVVAPIVGGAVAGSAQESPLLHGAVAVAAPAGAFLVVRAIVGGVQGTLTATQVVTFVLYLVVFTALGMLGGYVGFRRRQRLA
jgi:ABC-type Na+ efflux pump permease subunit